MVRLASIADFLALRRGLAGVLVVTVLVGLGERLGWRFLPLYLDGLGGGAAAVALLGAMTNLLGALYSLPGGWLSDRLGTRVALPLFTLWASLGFLLVIVAPTWPVALLGACLFLSWSAVSQPAGMRVVVDALPAERRTMGVSVQSLVRRVPLALGPLIGGWLIRQFGEDQGIRIGYATALVLAIAALPLLVRLLPPAPARAAPEARRPSMDPRRLWKQMSRPLRGLLLSDTLIRFCEQIPDAFVVLWCMERIARPVDAVQFGWLSVIEMATAGLVYIPVARLADRGGKKPFVLLTFVFFTLFPLSLLFSESFWLLAGAFVLRGMKEFGEPARKALILDLCPADQKATMFGFYYLVRDVAVSAAALAGGWLWLVSPATNFAAAFLFGAIGTIGFAIWGRDIERGGAPAGEEPRGA